MALHQDQVARIHEWLLAHVHEQCPACGLSNWWQIQDRCYGLPCVALDSLNLGEGLEFIATTCRRCAYTAFFLASRMSIKPCTTTGVDSF
jgi:predicted nucleic-acid-binding Zn-ribbon protein